MYLRVYFFLFVLSLFSSLPKSRQITFKSKGAFMAAGDIISYFQNNNKNVQVEDESGNPQRATLVATPGGFGSGGGSSVVAPTPFDLAVKSGRVPNYQSVEKFGLNPEITAASGPEDVWEAGGIYPYDINGTAPIVSLISDNAADTEKISVFGLDINGNFVTQDIMLNGTTRVALTTPLWRVYRLANIGSDSLQGTVYCYVGTGGVPVLADVRAIIENGNNQTLMDVFTVPLGFVGFLYRWECGLEWEGGPASGSEYARCYYQTRFAGKVFRIRKAITIISTASSVYQNSTSFPEILPALTDAKVTVAEVSTTMGVWATFDLLLVAESEFTPEYLAAIGQPFEVPT